MPVPSEMKKTVGRGSAVASVAAGDAGASIGR
jgi:hypothetical protein